MAADDRAGRVVVPRSQRFVLEDIQPRTSQLSVSESNQNGDLLDNPTASRNAIVKLAVERWLRRMGWEANRWIVVECLEFAAVKLRSQGPTTGRRLKRRVDVVGATCVRRETS